MTHELFKNCQNYQLIDDFGVKTGQEKQKVFKIVHHQYD